MVTVRIYEYISQYTFIYTKIITLQKLFVKVQNMQIMSVK